MADGLAPEPAVTLRAFAPDGSVRIAPGRNVFYTRMLYLVGAERIQRTFVYEHVGPRAPTLDDLNAACRAHLLAHPLDDAD